MTSQATLRSLAKDYANGNLSTEKYREERTIYIESVVAGTVSVHLKEAPAESRQDHSGSVTQRKPDDSRSVSTDINPSKSWMILLAGGAVVALLVIIALIVIPADNEDDISAPADSVAVAVAPATTPVETQVSAAQSLIRSFIATNVWTDASMGSFLATWDTIPVAEKAGISNSTEFSQLTSSIMKKLVEERALSTIGNPETSLEKQRQLVNFAASIGINDSRISLPQSTNLENP